MDVSRTTMTARRNISPARRVRRTSIQSSNVQSRGKVPTRVEVVQAVSACRLRGPRRKRDTSTPSNFHEDGKRLSERFLTSDQVDKQHAKQSHNIHLLPTFASILRACDAILSKARAYLFHVSGMSQQKLSAFPLNLKTPFESVQR